MASFTQQAEERSDRLMSLWSKRYIPLYLVMAALSGYATLDLVREPVEITSTVSHVGHHTEVSPRMNRWSRSVPPEDWSIVHLADGSSFQVRSAPDAFLPGDTVDATVTWMRHEVLRYKRRRSEYPMWTTISDPKAEANLYPVLVLIISLLLLLPIPSLEFRWGLHGALLLIGFAWIITLIGTGGLRMFF